MNGAGNSFVIVEISNPEDVNLPDIAITLCGENRCDGLMAIKKSSNEDADFDMLFYNSDGTQGEMCGNGARCIARYGFEHGYSSNGSNIRFMATAGLIIAKRINENYYEVRLNDPSILIPRMKAKTVMGDMECSYTELGNPGIPHAVVVSDISIFDDLYALRERGRALRKSESFHKGANVTFAALTDTDTVRAITFERGVEDFTLACGTGCGATSICLAALGLIKDGMLNIEMPGGHLETHFDCENGEYSNILLTGPTAYGIMDVKIL